MPYSAFGNEFCVDSKLLPGSNLSSYSGIFTHITKATTERKLQESIYFDECSVQVHIDLRANEICKY